MRKVAATLVVVTLVAVLFSGCLGTGGIKGFSSTDLKRPISIYANTSYPEIPQNTTNVQTEFRGYSINYTITEVYVNYGGILILGVQNDQMNQIYIYGYGLRWVDSGATYISNCGVYIDPGQSKEIGLLAFRAPTTAGFHEYEIVIKVLAKNQLTQVWNDYGESSPASKYVYVSPEATNYNYTVTSNERTAYDMVNSRVDFDIVKGIVSDIQTKVPGPYSISQIIQAYLWVHQNIEYKTDENGDYWQSSQETLALRTGDCEDQAILLASVINVLGGSARVNLIDEHAFPTVYVGSSLADVNSTNQAIRSYYGAGSELHMSYLHDVLGYWLVVDSTGFPYPGGLPAKSVAMSGSDSDAWIFDGTTYLITVDVTGQQAGKGLFNF